MDEDDFVVLDGGVPPAVEVQEEVVKEKEEEGGLLIGELETPGEEEEEESETDEKSSKEEECDVTEAIDSSGGLSQDCAEEQILESTGVDHVDQEPEWCLMEDDGVLEEQQAGPALLKEQMVARVFRFKTLLQKKLEPRGGGGKERGGEQARERGGDREAKACAQRESGGVVSPRGGGEARPVRVACGMAGCEERAEKHGGCSKCGRMLCSTHSIEAEAANVDSSARWRGRPRVAPLMGFVHCEEEVFSLLTDTVMLCPPCEDRFVQTIGRAIDRSDRYFSLRAKGKARASKALAAHVDLMLPQAERFVREPMAAMTSAVKTQNPFKNLTLRVAETWATCAGCGEYFERMKKKSVCQLCARSFCADCGTALVQFSARQLLADYSQIIDQCGRKVSPIRVECCNVCTEALLRLSRKRKFVGGLISERGKKIQEHYAAYKESERELAAAFGQFLAQQTLQDAAVHREQVNRWIGTYKRIGNLLIAMAARPQSKRMEPTPTDLRLAQQLARVQKNVLTNYLTMLHSHDEFLRGERP